MSINLTVPSNTETPELKPRITVVGVGGAGGNAVDNMIRRQLEGVDFVVANTDAQALTQSTAERRIQLGTHLTQGLGAGAKPEVGRAAAEEAIDELLAGLDGAHMAFIAAGMGGGTGTGAAPIIAEAARKAGILTVGVVTKPFQFEGSHRMKLAEEGIRELEQYVDTLIIIPNQNLFRVANENTTFADAFAMADEVLYSGVRGVTDLIVMPGLINLDFADIRSVMSEMGKAMMGTGEADGERRALDAAEAAIANPLLEDTSMKGANGVLINITGGQDITLFEVDEAATRIREEVDSDAHIIVGSAFDTGLDGRMRVSVVATGIDANASRLPQPTMLNVIETRARRIEVEQQPEPEAAEGPAAEESTEVATETPTDAVIDDPVTEVQEAAETAETAAAAEEAPKMVSPLERLIESVETETEADLIPGATESIEEVDTAEPEAAEAPAEPEAVEMPEEKPAAPKAAPALGATDAFIPPKPAGTSSRRIEEKPEPFAAAAMLNGAQPAKESEDHVKTDRPSLFERVTRTGRAAIGLTPSHETRREADLEPFPAAASAPVPPAVAKKPEPSPAEMPQGTVADIAPTASVTEIDPKPAPAAVESEEDLLDIPAFLRRQAN